MEMHLLRNCLDIKEMPPEREAFLIYLVHFLKILIFFTVELRQCHYCAVGDGERWKAMILAFIRKLPTPLDICIGC